MCLGAAGVSLFYACACGLLIACLSRITYKLNNYIIMLARARLLPVAEIGELAAGVAPVFIYLDEDADEYFLADKFLQ